MENILQFAKAASTPRNRLVHCLLRGLGPNQRFRPAFSPAVSSLRHTNRVSGRSPSSPGCPGPHSNRNAGRSLRWPRRFYRSDVFRRRTSRFGARRCQLQKSAHCGLPSRNGGVVICRWRGLCFPLVFHGEPGQRARCVRVGEHRAVGGSVPGPRGGCRIRISRGLLGNVGHPAGLGRGVRHLWAKCDARSSAKGFVRDARRTRPRTIGVGAGRILFSDLWWIRRLLDLSANLAARSIWSQACERRFPNRRIRRARHCLPAARWLASRPDWRVASSFVDSAGRRRFRIVARRAVDAAIHGWSAGMRRLARHRQRRRISACAAIFSDSESNGNRTGRRDGWNGRIFPASSPRHVP